MKNLKYILTSLFVFPLLFQSCEDLEEVDVPNFTVTQTTATAKAGEPVEFKVENASNFLRFYSGEFGHEYKHSQRTNAEGTVYMSFNNAQKYGKIDNAKGTLSVLASTDYDGTGTKEAIKLATWTDISDRFTISEAYTFDWTYSGDAVITDLENGGTIYFAIRMYAEEHKDTGHQQAEWRINEFSVRKDLDDSGNFLNILDIAIDNKSGFTGTSVDEGVFDWNGHQWYWESGNKVWRWRPEKPRHRNDDWLITDGLNLSAVSPDEGVNLKTYSTPLDTFSHTYAAAGTYSITLVGNNTTINGSEESVQELTITVTE